MEQFARNIPLIGETGQRKLSASRVLIVGVGGVGGYALEMLTRCGVGSFVVVDMDNVDITNINRQIFALHSTLGRKKVDVAAARMRDVNPNVDVITYAERYCKDIENKIFADSYDYCIDAIDSVRDKVDLISACKKYGVRCISALGAGNRTTSDFTVKDIFSTSGDGLARAVRSKLRKEGVENHKTVCASSSAENIESAFTASISYVPPMMGCLLAQEVIKDLLCL